MSNVSVPLIVDTVAELEEEFNLRLNVPSSLSPSITVGGRNVATAIITDSISKFVIM